MTTIVTRLGKGSALSWQEADDNFTNLNTDKLEAGDLIASSIVNTPAGTISATNVQTAINELDTEKATVTDMNLKAPIASPVFTGLVTSPQYYNVTQLYGALQVSGVDVLRFGSDASGQLAGFRNILINGDMRINQRGVTIAAAANGTYGPDRWKKVDASNMTQIVESGNYKPSATYTLSGTGVTTQQITSPASGNWTLPNIPIAATNVQLEEGSIATPFEHRPIGAELALCQRYFEVLSGVRLAGSWASANSAFIAWLFKTTKRAVPTFSGTIVGSIDGINGIGVDGVLINNAAGGYATINVGATASAEL